MLVYEGPQKPIRQSKGTPAHIADVSTLLPCRILKNFAVFKNRILKHKRYFNLFFAKVI
jgi:hypothetical protein